MFPEVAARSFDIVMQEQEIPDVLIPLPLRDFLFPVHVLAFCCSGTEHSFADPTGEGTGGLPLDVLVRVASVQVLVAPVLGRPGRTGLMTWLVTPVGAGSAGFVPGTEALSAVLGDGVGQIKWLTGSNGSVQIGRAHV